MSGKCCSKNFVLSAIVITAYGWLFDFLVHGKLFMHMYVDTAALWRPDSEMQQMMPFCIGYHIVIAFIITGGYLCWRKRITIGPVGSSECPYRQSMGFGLWLGLILGLSAATTYIFLPMPGKLALVWLGANTVKWVIGGALLEKLYKPEAPVA